MKYAVISSNNNPDYFTLIPMVCKQWELLGYRPIVLLSEEIPNVIKKASPGAFFATLEGDMGDMRKETIAQISRLFACQLPFMNEDDFIVTSDSDMMVMKDIFLNRELMTSYGKDLTGWGEVPICYVAGSVREWRRMMNINGTTTSIVEEIIYQSPDTVFSKEWEKYWGADQQLLTKRMDDYPYAQYVPRTMDRGLAYGRKDRYDWNRELPDLIDAHLLRGNGYKKELKAFAAQHLGEHWGDIVEVIFSEVYGG